ncbi:MAG: hypothetical protein KME28_04035 [Pelatocladus maniniholoensis HA4357-MV3]|uniref:Uncharacterized protein n=1 Tax=Pelatocladus maniniholoensis HA4357-MV3 TaxID=1117104 RepID=A0A9E3H4P0_9NOST|nr:hypothetical protein [Pelatocladus maniniholoensis HA4357-MV3]BAZ70775.1 hypothetical protein NIES4106_55720 [Fischerella sp. NIES-4106]
MTNQDNNELAVVKGAIPKTLKLQFKVLCVKKELQMSAVLEDLIRQWIQTGAPIPEVYDDLLNEESEDVKGYIPKSLKLRFKIICTHKRLKIRFVLYALIQEWVETALQQSRCKM